MKISRSNQTFKTKKEEKPLVIRASNNFDRPMAASLSKSSFNAVTSHIDKSKLTADFGSLDMTKTSNENLKILSTTKSNPSRTNVRNLTTLNFKKSDAIPTIITQGQTPVQTIEKSPTLSNNKLNTIEKEKDIPLIENEYKPEKLEVRDPTINPEANKVEQANSSNIKVVARFRPLNEFEEELVKNGTGSLCCEFSEHDLTAVKIKTNSSVNTPPYQLDRIFRCDTDQKQIYDSVAKEMLLDIVNGYNGTIFTYGQSGSGKTHTMYGADIYDDTLKGIIPRTIDHLFEIIENSPDDISYQIKFSIIQIYKECVYDLITGEKDLKVKESPSRGIYVDGLSEFFINSTDRFLELLQLSQEQRIVSGTKLNSQSSRSHTIFMLELTSTNKIKNVTKKGCLNLVDLAGTEKIKKTGAVGETLEEAKKINLSLSALGNVIHALTQGESYIPYRDSKLTRILQESLGGNYKTTLLVACSPHSYHCEETVSTLKFAQRAKTIKNKVKMNIKLSYDQLLKIIKNYKEDIDKLNKNNEKLKNRIRSLIASGNIINTNTEEILNLDQSMEGEQQIIEIKEIIKNDECDDIHVPLQEELEEKNELINQLESQIIELKDELKESRISLEQKNLLLQSNNTELLNQIKGLYDRINTIKEEKMNALAAEKDTYVETINNTKKQIVESNTKFIGNSFLDKCVNMLNQLKSHGIDLISNENIAKLGLVDENFVHLNSSYLIDSQTANLKAKLNAELLNSLNLTLINQNTILAKENTILLQLIEDVTDINYNLVDKFDFERKNSISNKIKNEAISSFIMTNDSNCKGGMSKFMKGVKNILSMSITGRPDDSLNSRVETFLDRKTLNINNALKKHSTIQEEQIIKSLMDDIPEEDDKQGNALFKMTDEDEDSRYQSKKDINSKPAVVETNKKGIYLDSNPDFSLNEYSGLNSNSKRNDDKYSRSKSTKQLTLLKTFFNQPKNSNHQVNRKISSHDMLSLAIENEEFFKNISKDDSQLILFGCIKKHKEHLSNMKSFVMRAFQETENLQAHYEMIRNELENNCMKIHNAASSTIIKSGQPKQAKQIYSNSQQSANTSTAILLSNSSLTNNLGLEKIEERHSSDFDSEDFSKPNNTNYHRKSQSLVQKPEDLNHKDEVPIRL